MMNQYSTDTKQLNPVPSTLTTAVVTVILLLTLHGATGAADKTHYISQSYIDTVVQNVFLNFNNADELAATGMTREKAIAEAKLLIRRLRKLAETDPNKSYILWKVGELESHVYLEEQGVLLDKQRRQQKTANDLVAPFNSETAKNRPDFTVLWRIQGQMSAADPGKGDELEVLIRERARNISREACEIFDRAVDDRNLDKARTELAYVKTQQAHLGISQVRYARMSARLQSRVTVDDEIAFIKGAFQKMEQAVAAGHLGEARQYGSLAALRLDGARILLIKPEWDRLDGRLRGLAGRIATQEDSLVQAGILILKKSGISAAKDFLEHSIRPTEMAPEKIVRLETEVLRTAAAAHQAQDTSVKAEFASLYRETGGGTDVMADMMAKARQKAREKRDSLAGIPDARKGGVTQIEEVRRERADISLTNRQDRALVKDTPGVNHGLSQVERLRRERGQLAQTGVQERAAAIVRENHDRAEKNMVAIYTLLEQKKTKEACGQFTNEKNHLQRYLPQDTYQSLDSAIAACAKKTKKR